MLAGTLQAQILARAGKEFPPRPTTSKLQGQCAAVVNLQATAIGLSEVARSPCLGRATAQPARKGALLPEITVDALVSAKAHKKVAPNTGQKSSGDAAPAPGTSALTCQVSLLALFLKELPLQHDRAEALMYCSRLAQDAHLIASPATAQGKMGVRLVQDLRDECCSATYSGTGGRR